MSLYLKSTKHNAMFSYWVLSADNSITEVSMCSCVICYVNCVINTNAVEYHNGSSPEKATGSTGVAGTPLRNRNVTF